MYLNRPSNAYVSAYGLAKAQGFTGTLDEWLASLHAYVHIKYANIMPTADSDMKDQPDNWMGIATTNDAEAPVHYTSYKWNFVKGEAQASLICEEYSATSTYSVGEYVAYAEEIWECTTTIATPEAFTPSHWLKVNALNRISERVAEAEEVAAEAEAAAAAPDPTTFSAAVPVAKGGTGAATAAAARENLGITPANIGARPANEVTSVEHGGTGASTAATARTNLGITPANIGLTEETWTFVRKSDGATVTKKVYINGT